MMKEMIVLLDRDLNKLSEEIKSYRDEPNIWVVKGEIKNSAGNLCCHLLGNLNHFIGAILGKTGYVRNRELEFSSKDISRKDLVAEIEKVKGIIHTVLNKLDPKDLETPFPAQITGGPMSTRHFLLHLYGHLNYHLGQINYHRRLIEN